MRNQQLGNTTYLFSFFLLFFCLPAISFAQINEPKSTPVYDYLYRMAQKGLIEWPDWQSPLQRNQIQTALSQLALTADSLSTIEKAELNFYNQEYAFDSDTVNEEEQKTILRNDAARRFRALSYKKDDKRLFIDPIVGGSLLFSGHQSHRQYFSGVRLGAYFGKRWGVQFSFRDYMEKGDTLDRSRNFSTDEGIIPTINTGRSVNYSRLNFNLSYRWSNGNISVGQENLSWGYGMGGNNILSGKAPAYPFVKLDYQPWPWLHFSYFHGWLHSNIIDSAASYGTGTGVIDSRREVFRPKYIAQHSIVVTPTKGLQIGIGESMIYSDELNIGYLIPVSFFRIFDHQKSRYNIKASDNSQFFGMVSSRNHLPKTHIYAQLFIDEIRLTKIFSQSENRNQLGYTFGINRTDFFLHYLTLGIEYTRQRPFIYNNLIPTQTYASHDYALGDWIGNNADRLYAFAHYTPLPKLKIKAWLQKVRKGGAGTLDQQYFQSPQPPFLFDKQFDWQEGGASITYEWLNKLLFSLQLNRTSTQYPGQTVNRSGVRFGFSYGL